ncbi:hypothetical protein [uncultured Tenacibaculum sp.]|uniref:hypothetical protein n=1 Tax=uncultured Tenacibaculum sp. TaxID=174713 RepID=UPI002639348E|nr:hypothetical protein [uncultured Tenacibaculum sp.]
MSNSILNAKVKVLGLDSHHTYNAILTIQPEEELVIDHIDGIVYLEARGRMSSVKKPLVNFKIENRKVLAKNEIFEIPFSFTLSEDYIESYDGKNVSISYNCEAKIFVNKEDLEKLDRGVFTRMKSFFTSDYSTKISGYFTKIDEGKYKISEHHSELKLAFNFKSLLFTALVIGSIYIAAMLGLKFDFHGGHIFLLIITTVITNYFLFQIKKKQIGDISLTTSNRENEFVCYVKPARNFSLHKAKMYYQIVEKVVDNRGTSSTTYRETIYKSSIKPVKGKGSSEIEFEYPFLKNLATMEFDDSSIYWEIVINGMHNGISEKLTCTIEAYKV